MIRLRLLRSPEFRRRLVSLGIVPEEAGPNLDRLAEGIALDPGTTRYIFFHVPKCGGTTLHHHLEACFSPQEISRFRGNDLLAAPLLEVAGARLFSGHFDRRAADALPGSDNLQFTLLREPKARLVSVYRYLRAHSRERITGLDLALANAAQQHDFEGFLRAALEINPAVVDNCYARTFGSALPVSRWESSAEAAWMAHHKCPSETEWAKIFARAKTTLSGLAVVGTLETIEEDARRIVALCDGTLTTVDHLKDLSKLTQDVVGFGKPPPPIDDIDFPLLEKLTRFDAPLYALARTRSG